MVSFSPYRHESLRIAMQTAVGAAAAYGVGLAIGREAESWAVFSAVFVVQGNVGGSLDGALHRVFGAAIGVAVALATVFTIGVGEWRTMASLVVAVGAMSLVAGRHPSTAYGLVTATMIVVTPGIDLLESALRQSAGIVAGAVTGALASIAVFPRSAARQSDEAVAAALRGCGELLERSLGSILGDPDRDLAPVHRRIEEALGRARRTNPAARREKILSGSAPGRRPTADTVERLWYTLALLDRLSARPLPRHAADRLDRPLRSFAAAARDALDELAGPAGRRRSAAPGALSDEADAVEDAVDGLRTGPDAAALDRRAAVDLMALAFAVGEASRHVGELAPGRS